MILRLAEEKEAALLTDISVRAFHSDALVGMEPNDGPPDYDSVPWHTEMYRTGHLYTYLNEAGEIVGGAVLFENKRQVYVGRIFIDPRYFRRGYGVQLMADIETLFPAAEEFVLDTPVDNVRTNALYQKVGYEECGRDEECVSYKKKR